MRKPAAVTADHHAIPLSARVTVLAEGFADEHSASLAARSRIAGSKPQLVTLSRDPVLLHQDSATSLSIAGSISICPPQAGLPEPVKSLLTALMLHLAEEPAPLPARARQRDALTSQILDMVGGKTLRLRPPPASPGDEP